MMACRLCLLILLISAFSHSFLFAQGNAYIHYGVAEGLPSNEVYTVIKDRNGFLWFGTDNGVVRFDGGEFEVFNLEQGLLDPVVFGLHEDAQGRIWFRSFTGKLCYFHNDKIHHFPFNDRILEYTKNATITGLHYDNEKTLWLSILNQLIKIDSTGQLAYQKTGIDTLALHKADAHHYLFSHGSATPHVSLLFDGENAYPLSHSIVDRSSENVFFVEWNGANYLSINADLFRISHTIELVMSAPSIITSLRVDQDNKLWLGLLNEGVIYLTKPEFENPERIEELNNKSVTGILQDEEKGYWITTLEQGVFYFPNFSVKQYLLPSNSKINSVNNTSDIIITTDFSGIVSAFDPESAELVWQKNLGYAIVSSYIDQKEQIWVSTNGQTFILSTNGEILKENLPSNIIDFSALDDNIYAITNYGHYLFATNGNHKRIRKPDAQFRNILATEKHIYMGGKNGLSVFDHELKFIEDLDYFSDIKVTNLTKLTDSIIFVSTTGSGFVLLNKFSHQATGYSRSQHFVANNVYSVVINNSLIWLGTENGIVTCTISNLLNGKPDFNFVTRYNGLVSDKVNNITILKDKLWAFSDNGFIVSPISKIRYINQKPKAFLNELFINNQPVSYIKPLRLNHDQNNINFRIRFLSINNQHIITRFRLTKTEDWSISNDLNFEFNSLSPGNYNLEIEYSVDNFHWQPSELSFPFIIHPPWWNTVYFYALVSAILLATAVIVYKKSITQFKERDRYLNLINEQQKKLLNAEIEATERERNRIANDLHDGVSTDLISINLMLKRVSKKLNQDEFIEIESQLNNTIAGIKSIIYDLTPPGLQFFGLSAGIQNYLNIIRKSSTIEFRYEFLGEELKDPNTGGIIFRIVQELINNSIKHAECSEIKISIVTNPDSITLSFSDNGHGFDINWVRHGLGLSSIQSRVELLEGTVSINSNSTGTIYHISIPLRNYKRINK